jgi:hypothetical protein
VLSYFRSFKSLVALAALASTLILGGCGGGGAKDPFDPGPQAPALTVTPGAVTVYSNIPSVVTITSGVAPFQVFSSDNVVLPVTSSGGTLVTLVPTNVPSDTPVTLTIRDGLNRAVTVAVTVKPATLVNSVTIVPIANSECSSGAGGGGGGGTSNPSLAPIPICSGDTATVNVTVRNANTSVIPNRQVRFDAVFGNYQFVTDVNGSNPTNSVTLITDQNGQANALIRTASAAPSQAALVRVTDLVTGNRVDTAFTIVQQLVGEAVLSVVPKEYVGQGFFTGECGGSSGDYIIYGGRPPYTVRSSLPGAVSLSVGGISGDPVTVLASGGSFRASTAFSAAGCTGYKAQIVITDAAGLNTTVSYEEKPGTNALPTPPAPTTLVISPSAPSVTCSLNRAVSFTIIGGTAPYGVRTSRPADVSVDQIGAGATVTITAPAPLPPTTKIDVEVVDSKSNTAKATITCL